MNILLRSFLETSHKIPAFRKQIKTLKTKNPVCSLPWICLHLPPRPAFFFQVLCHKFYRFLEDMQPGQQQEAAARPRLTPWAFLLPLEPVSWVHAAQLAHFFCVCDSLSITKAALLRLHFSSCFQRAKAAPHRLPLVAMILPLPP